MQQEWVKVLRPTRHRIGHFGDVLPSQSLGLVLKELNPTQHNSVLFSPPHRSTLLCSDVVKFVRRVICGIVRYLPDRKNVDCLSNFRYCANRAQNLPGPDPTFGSYCSIQIGSLTFSGVIAERVKTVLLLHGVFPWFALNTFVFEANNNAFC